MSTEKMSKKIGHLDFWIKNSWIQSSYFVTNLINSIYSTPKNSMEKAPPRKRPSKLTGRMASFTLPKDLDFWAVAAKADITLSELVRNAVREYAKKHNLI